MSRLTIAKSFRPSPPGSGKAAVYFDQNGVKHVLDTSGVDTVVSGRGWNNYVRNSGFWFAQRQTPGTLTTYSDTSSRTITADGWGVTNQNASVQYQRADTISAPEAGLQARFYGKFLKITNSGKIVVSQMIEGMDSMNLRGRVVRLQCKLKAFTSAGTPTSLTGSSWRLGLLQLTQQANTVDQATPFPWISAFGVAGIDPTLGLGAGTTSLAYLQPVVGQAGDNCRIRENGADCIVTRDWQRFGALFYVPIGVRNLYPTIWADDQVLATNGIAISEVSLTDGYEPQEWTCEDYATELKRVQRYYVKTFGIDTAPAQNVGVDTGHLDCIVGKAGATALAAQFSWRLPVRLATNSIGGIPGFTTSYNPAAADAQARNINTGTSFTATSATTQQGLAVRVTGTGIAGMAVGDRAGVHVTVDAELL